MRLSSIFIPVSKNGPAKMKDPGVVNLVKAGYALYDNNRENVMLLPLGVDVAENLVEEIRMIISGATLQHVVTGMEKEGGLSIASRALKTEDQLPLYFMEFQGKTLYLSAFLREERDPVEDQENMLFMLQYFTDSLDMGTCITEEQVFQKDGSSGKVVSLCAGGDKRTWQGEPGVLCPSCGWGGKGVSWVEPLKVFSEEPEEVEEVHTPGADTIEELCRQLDLPPEKTVKTMFYTTEEETPRVVVALMRGDRKISSEKLAGFLGVSSVRFATPEELHKTMGILGGYLGPCGLPEGVLMVADYSVNGISNVAVGANKPDYHLRGVCWGRDFTASHVTDLLQLEPGSSCPLCGAPLEEQWWREIARLGPDVSLAETYASVDYRDREHKKKEPRIWFGEIHLDALLLALFEEEEKTLFAEISPLGGYIYAGEDVENPDEVMPLMEEIYQLLLERNILCLLDDVTPKGKNRTYHAEVLRFPWSIRVTSESFEQGKAVLRGNDQEEALLSPEEIAEGLELFFYGSEEEDGE